MNRRRMILWAVAMTVLAATGSAHAQRGWGIGPGTPTSVSQCHYKTFLAGFDGLFWPENWDEAQWYVDGELKYTETMDGQSDTTSFSWSFPSVQTYEVKVRAKWNLLGVPVWFGWLTWTVNVSSSVPVASRVSPDSPVTVYEGDAQAFTVQGTDPGGDLWLLDWYKDGVSWGGVGGSLGGSMTHTRTHTFDTSGTYEIAARFRDEHDLYSNFVYWTVNDATWRSCRLPRGSSNIGSLPNRGSTTDSTSPSSSMKTRSGLS